MASARGDHSEPSRHLLVLARLVGSRAVYGVQVDPQTHPGTIVGVAGPLERDASRRFLAGELLADPDRADWGQHQCWDFPVLDMRVAPVLGNDVPAPRLARPALPKTVTYRQEYVHCGKDTCTPCQSGLGHGPYWYAYWRAEGRLHKRYLGKTPPQSCGEMGGDAVPSA